MKISLLQYSAIADIKTNLEKSENIVKFSLSDIGDVLVYPEMFLYRGNTKKIIEKDYEIYNYKFFLNYFSELSKKINKHIICGSVFEKTKNNKFYNTSLIFDNNGNIVSKYRKMKLFKLNIKDNKIDETTYFEPGKKLINFKLGDFNASVLICFDLRFPELFRKLVINKKVNLIFLVSNFTKETGKAHWFSLLKSRAIENQIYIVAVNQHGKDTFSGIESYGNSTVISPWGDVLIKSKPKNYILNAEIDINYLKKIRQDLNVF